MTILNISYLANLTLRHYLALPVYQVCKRIVRDQPSARHLRTREAGAVPGAFRDGGHIVDGGRRHRMDREEVDHVVQDLPSKVWREALRYPRDGLRRGPAYEGVLWAGRSVHRSRSMVVDCKTLS